MTKVQGKTGVPIKDQAMIYKAVVQEVLLYGREIWVFRYAIVLVLEGFNHRIARRIVGIMERMREGGEWEWDSVEVALEAIGLWLMRYYMQRRKATIAKYVMGRINYNMCTGADKMEGSSWFLWWWYK